MEIHPHIVARQEQGPPTVAAAIAEIHGPGRLGRFNARFGLRITLIVGTMWAAYLFTLIALVSLPAAYDTGNSIILIGWIAQTFLQLVLLPIIIVGQNVQAKAADARSLATFEDATAILHTVLQLERHLQVIETDILALKPKPRTK